MHSAISAAWYSVPGSSHQHRYPCSVFQSLHLLGDVVRHALATKILPLHAVDGLVGAYKIEPRHFTFYMIECAGKPLVGLILCG